LKKAVWWENTVSEYISDEEQINRFNEWWQANGTVLLVAAGVAIAAIVGWNIYADQRQQSIEAGTAVYAEYAEAEDPDARQMLAERIKSEFPNTSFAALVALAEAKAAVDSGDLGAAQTALNTAKNAAPDALLSELASLRLAKVEYAMGDTAQALQTLQGVRSAGYESWALELSGDIYLAEGDSENAFAAYSRALENADEGANRPLLEIKRDNTAPANGEFSPFVVPLDQALQEARETLASDDDSESTPNE
jgi:predicted negative regulator of RcsB-dependent stress response